MNAFERLRLADYIAKPADIEEITISLSSSKPSEQLKGLYFRALIATTQDRLGIAIRERPPPNVPAPTALETQRQLSALNEVHHEFCAVVMTVIKLRYLTTVSRNNKSAFARTAKSVLSRWLEAGHNIAAVVASKAVQQQMLDELHDLEPSVERDKRAIARSAERALRRCAALPRHDRISAMLDLKKKVDTAIAKAMQTH
jgi:HAMP domain-containing protein